MADPPAEEETVRQPVTQSDDEDWTIARVQSLFAADGLALNQCPYCGSFRTDGLPPVLHQPGCPGEHPWMRPGVIEKAQEQLRRMRTIGTR